jgi:drug/metabolite transporter (DMT)-like permease
MIQLPLIGAFLEAAGMAFEKRIMKQKYMDFKTYSILIFSFLVILMIPLTLILWNASSHAFETKYILLLIGFVLTSLIANLLIYYSLDREDIVELEPIWVMHPLFVVIFAFIFYESERNILDLGLAFIAGYALVTSHIKKHKIRFDKYSQAAIFGGILFAIAAIMSKTLLDVYNGFTLYFIRCLLILLILFIFIKPNKKAINKKNLSMFPITALIWIGYWLIVFYGYEKLGLISTTLLIIFSPVLLFLFAVLFLKEKPTTKQIFATLIIVLCVAAHVFINIL